MGKVIPYGISAVGLVNRHVVDNADEAQDLIDGWYMNYPDAKRYLKYQAYNAISNHYTQTPTGRIRWYQIPEGLPKNEREMLESSAARQGQNMTIQSCIDWNSRVLTKEHGYTEIKNLPLNQRLNFWDGTNWSLARVIDRGLQEHVKVTLQNGQELDCSVKHKFLKVSTEGYRTWVEAQDLKHGDRVIVTSSLVGQFNVPSKFTPVSRKYRVHNANYYDFNKTYTQVCSFELGYLFGRIASDGMVYISEEKHKYVTTLLVAEHEKEILNRLTNTLSALELKFKIRTQFKDGYIHPMYHINIHSKDVAEQLHVLKQQKIPDFVLCNSEILRGYISGIFCGDGTATKAGEIILTGGKNVSHSWFKQIQECLLLFDIQSKFAFYKDDRVVLRIKKRDAKTFVQKISFGKSEKNNRVLDSLPVVSKYKTRSKKMGLNVKVEKVVRSGLYTPMCDVADSDTSVFMVNGIVTHNTSADITKQALVDCYKYLKRTNYGSIILTIHDSIFFKIREDVVEEATNAIMELMTAAGTKVHPNIMVPVDADVGIKETRLCKVTNLPFSVYTHLHTDDKRIIKNPQWIEPRLNKIVGKDTTDYNGAFVRLQEFIKVQSPEWRHDNKDIVDSVEMIQNKHSNPFD